MNSELKKELIKVIKKLDGTLISVCVNDKEILDEIEKNKKINKAYNLEKGKKKFTKKQKHDGYSNISIKKWHKKIKMNMDYMICDMNEVNTYLKTLINSSFDKINKQIIFYGIYDEYEIDKIKTKYQRFNAKVETEKYDNYYLVKIDTSKINYKKVKHIFYKIIDFFIDLVDAIGNSLMQ